MTLIVGLGNPGKKYIHTRHNLGFRVLDAFAKENNFPVFRLSKKFQAAISEGVLGAQKIILAKPQTFMNESGQAVKRITTNYPRRRASSLRGRQLPTTNFYVVHDDIDLPLGKIKISIGRGAGGHKGVESIIKELGTKDFIRIRVGLGLSSCLGNSISVPPPFPPPRGREKFLPPYFPSRMEGEPSLPLIPPPRRGGGKGGGVCAKFKVKSLEDFVLQKFTKEEEKTIRQVIKKACQSIEIALNQGIEKAMIRFNVDNKF